MRRDQHFWNNERLQKEWAAAMNRWKESELVLDCLRTKKGQTMKTLTEEEIFECSQIK